MPRHAIILKANDLRQYNPAKAVEMVEALLLEGDTTAPPGGAYDLLGQEYLRAGDLKSAKDSFEKDLEVYPDSHSTFLYMGLIEEVNGNIQEAQEWYDKAPEREFDSSYVAAIKAKHREWKTKYPNSESRIKLLNAGKKPQPFVS
jgi:tetratricopeptide (TPR) repeat protein